MISLYHARDPDHLSAMFVDAAPRDTGLIHKLVILIGRPHAPHYRHPGPGKKTSHEFHPLTGILFAFSRPAGQSSGRMQRDTHDKGKPRSEKLINIAAGAGRITMSDDR